MRVFRAVAFALSIVLLGGTLVPTSASAEDVADAADVADVVTDPSSETPNKARPNTPSTASTTASPKQVISGLEVLVTSVNAVRAGGDGAIELDVAHRSANGVTAYDAQLFAKFGRGIQVANASGPGWKCRTSRTEVACRTDAIEPGEDGNSIFIELKGAPNLKNGTVRAKTWVKWKETRGAREFAAGILPRTSGKSKWVRHVERTTSKVPTSKALGVKLTRLGPATRLTDGVGEDDLVLFSANISGMNGAKIPIAWRQLCTSVAEVRADPDCEGVAPEAVLLQPASDRQAEEDGSLSVSLPVVTKPTKLTFEAAVMDSGVRVASRASVIAVPFAPIEYSPKVDTVEEFANVASDMSDRTALQGLKQTFTQGTITGGVQPRAGERMQLRLRMPNSQVKNVSWSVSAGSASLLANAKQRGSRVSFTPAKSAAGTSAVVKATATLANGRSIEFSKLLTFEAPPGAQTTQSYTLLSGDVADQRSKGAVAAERATKRMNEVLDSDQRARFTVGTAEGTLCSLAQLVSTGQMAPLPQEWDTEATPDFVLEGGAMVWMGNTATTSDRLCNGSTTIAVENAVIQYGQHTFEGVRGTISSSGFVIKGGTYLTPEEWTKSVPGFEGAKARIPFEVPDSLPVDAKLKSTGAWGALGGEVSFSTGLELLKLPAGWKFQPATLRFETTGLMALTITARAPSSGTKTAEQLGRVSITGAVSPSGELEVGVTAANLVAFEDADGNEVTLDFAGSLAFSWEDDPSAAADTDLAFKVVPDISAAVNNVKFAENVVAERIAVSWTPGRIEGEFNLRIGNGDEANTISLVKSAFVYEGTKSWLVTANYEGAWDVGAGLKINSLKGEIEKDGDRLNITLGGDATGWKPSSAFELSKITAEVTNKCAPAASDDAAKQDSTELKCSAKNVRVDLAADGQLNISGKPIDWTTRASFDLRTKKYTIEGTVTNADGIGPEQFKLRNLSIAFTNEETDRICQPQSQVASDAVFKITAAGTVLGAAVDFAGEYSSSSGTCFVGSMRSGEAKNLDLPSPQSFSSVQFAWVSQDALLDLSAGRTPAKGKQLIISAMYKVSDEWKSIGVTQGRFLGTFGYGQRGTSISAEIFVDFGNAGGPGPIVFGSAGANNLTIDAVGFEVSYSGSGSFALTAAGLMTYRTVANQATDSIDSQTPFSVAISVGTRGLVVQSKIDTDRARSVADRALTLASSGTVTPKQKAEYTTPGEIQNAFGISGLTVRQLGISAGIGVNTFVAFNADVTLPERWTSAIGMHPNSQVQMGGALSQTNPCFKFDLKVDPRFADANAFVVNLGNGLLAARQLRLLVAPTGCVLPGDEVIDPGFGMTFDGLIGGKFALKVAIDVSLPTTSNPNFKVDANIQASELNLGSVVKIKETTLGLKIDTAQSLFELRVVGGIDVLGQTANIDAYFKAQGLGNITLRAKSNVNLNILGVIASDANLDVAFEMANFDVKLMQIDVTMAVKVLGTKVAGLRAALIYDQGKVINLELAVSVGLNIIVASFSGTLGISYYYDCNGEKLCASKRYTHKVFKMYLDGKVRILFWRVSFHLDIVDYRKPLSSEELASQNAEWSETAESEVRSEEFLGWKSATRMDVYNKTVTQEWQSKVLSVKYDSAGKIATEDGEINSKRTSSRGDVVITSCLVNERTGACLDDRVFTHKAELYFQAKKLVLKNAYVSGSDVRNGRCMLSCQVSDVEFTDEKWTKLVELLNKARAEFAQANPGESLPPVKVWSKDRAPLSIGWTTNGGQETMWNIPGSTDLKYGALANTTGIVGDWDGNGYSEFGTFTGSPMSAGVWTQRQANGSSYQFQRFSCQRHCQPVEPPGTAQSKTLPLSTRNGADGFAFPIVGDWDEATVQHRAVDDLGVVFGYDGKLRWRLWPRNQKEFGFSFGKYGDGIVDRPVTGDWNGDGTTDIGVYRPAAKPGDTGKWLLLTSTSLRKQFAIGPNFEPDWTISYGGYGDYPVTGDWDNDGVDGIGVVSKDPNGGENIWSLRNFADFTCQQDCTADLTKRGGAWGSTPVVGRWKSSY